MAGIGSSFLQLAGQINSSQLLIEKPAGPAQMNDKPFFCPKDSGLQHFQMFLKLHNDYILYHVNTKMLCFSQ